MSQAHACPEDRDLVELMSELSGYSRTQKLYLRSLLQGHPAGQIDVEAVQENYFDGDMVSGEVKRSCMCELGCREAAAVGADSASQFF